MRLHRSLPLAAIAAMVLAGCGTQGGPTGAENNALQSVAHAAKVLSYPIPAKHLISFLPKGVEGSLGSPTYMFAVSVQGAKSPTWVVAGQSGVHALHVYKDIAELYAHAAAFSLGKNAPALQVLAASKIGKVSLQVVGVHFSHVTSAQLRKIGVNVSAGSYTLVSLLSLPAALHSPTADVANFVESQGKVVVEYGTNE